MAIEKNYVLGWLLAGIGNYTELEYEVKNGTSCPSINFLPKVLLVTNESIHHEHKHKIFQDRIYGWSEEVERCLLRKCCLTVFVACFSQILHEKPLGFLCLDKRENNQQFFADPI